MPTKANDEFAKIAAKAPILLKRSFKDEDIPTVKITHNRRSGSEKFVLPINRMDKIEPALYAVSEFQAAMEDREITGANLFTHFKATLRDVARENWEDAIEDVDDMDAEDAFDDTLTEFLSHLLTRKSWEYQKEYLDCVKRPSGMSPKILLNRLQAILRYCRFLPGFTAYGNDSLKKLYLKMFTEQHQAEVDLHFDVGQNSIVELADYLTRFDDSIKSQKPAAKSDNNGNGGGNGRTKHNSYRSSGGRNNYSSNRNSNNKRNTNGGGNRSAKRNDYKPRSMGPEDMCKHHTYLPDNHKWKDCVFNPKSDAYKARHERATSSSHHSSGGNTGQLGLPNGTNLGGSAHGGVVPNQGHHGSTVSWSSDVNSSLSGSPAVPHRGSQIGNVPHRN